MLYTNSAHTLIQTKLKKKHEKNENIIRSPVLVNVLLIVWWIFDFINHVFIISYKQKYYNNMKMPSHKNGITLKKKNFKFSDASFVPIPPPSSVMMMIKLTNENKNN